MPATTQAAYLGGQYVSYKRDGWSFRPVAGGSYLPGSIVQYVSADLQIYADANTVANPTLGTLRTKNAGIVSDTWPGFNGSIGAASYVAPSSLASIRGTLDVDAVIKGYHPAILLDQAGTGAVTLTDGLGIIPNGAGGTAGYGQGIGIAAATPLTVVAIASLPASGIGSSITAAALAQAAQTDTLSGSPSAGDVLSVTIQSPYIAAGGNTAQTTTWTAPPLTTAQAANVTAAALALLTYLNSQASFSQYFIASQAAGVVSVTVNALSNPFRVFFGPGIQGNTFSNFFDIGISGMIANSLTFAVATVSGTTVSTAGGANLASGTGYKGIVPGYVTSIL